jgi:hypothetical protein
VQCLQLSHSYVPQQISAVRPEGRLATLTPAGYDKYKHTEFAEQRQTIIRGYALR